MNQKKLIFFLIFLIISIISFAVFAPLAIFILIIGLILSFAIGYDKDYTKFFKENVMNDLVKGYDPKLSFDRLGKMPERYYRQAEFEGYDFFYSNDFIFGNLDGMIPIQLGDVRTENESTDSDGNTTRSVVFKGLFSSADLMKSINNTIKIRSDKGWLGKALRNKELMQMDSQEFEKNFDVYSTDKILAMRILTSDILDFMLTFKKQNKIKFELTLKDNRLFVRIHCSDMFEAITYKDSLDFDTLKKYYDFLNFICELNRKFFKVLAEKDL